MRLNFVHLVFQEYVDMVKQLKERVTSIEEEMRKAVASWSWGLVVEVLMAVRGVNLITAMTVVAEIGDMSRFESPRQLMAHLGLVPSEHSSGSRQKRGGITKTGNGQVRRILTEASWSYQLPARKTGLIHIRCFVYCQFICIQSVYWLASVVS